jgi:signal transduction histidine kinase
VIALGRAMLALMFLVSISLDGSQTAQAPAQTYALLFVYVLYALGLALLTWRNWWLDARLAAPAHALDMAVFTTAVFATNAYTSPFFLFFILPLLSAAIRWGWRETALTAAALILLYMTAGLLLSGTQTFELQRFIVRSGHLLILSAVLIWFGVHQQFTRLFFGVDELDRRIGRDEDPFPQALGLAMEVARAGSGALLVSSPEDERFSGICKSPSGARPASLDRPLMLEPLPIVLFDLKKNRSLATRSDGWYRFTAANRLLDGGAMREIGASEGLVAEVRTGTRRGWLVLWDIAELSVDFLEVGLELGRLAGAVLNHDALLSAIEEGAAVRTRLSLARDVHDSVVQFLAGAAFRVEAIRRESKDNAQVESDLKELKRLLIEEQGEIRAFVSALRRDRELELAEAVEELKGLAHRLGQQWSVDCRVEASNDDASIPIRLQLDLQQLLREAVANAVRHGGASRVDVDVGVDDDRLRLQVTDNGSGFGPENGSLVEPWSLKERVDRAHGSLSLLSKPGCTNVVITLPLNGVSA